MIAIGTWEERRGRGRAGHHPTKAWVKSKSGANQQRAQLPCGLQKEQKTPDEELIASCVVWGVCRMGSAGWAGAVEACVLKWAWGQVKRWHAPVFAGHPDEETGHCRVCQRPAIPAWYFGC